MGVITVLKLTAEIISTCYTYGAGVKNASRDKKNIIDQSLGLHKVLDDVRKLAEDVNEKTRESSRFPALIELLNLPDSLPRCRAELESLKTRLEIKGRCTDRIKALMWPFKEGQVKTTLDHLRQFQQLLNLTLSVDQTYITPPYRQISPDLPSRRLALEMHTDVKAMRLEPNGFRLGV